MKKSKPSPYSLRITLQPDEAQAARLRALQATFARMCNALAPVVQQTRLWDRVALHRMAYRALRQNFPEAGSQLACNAIYAVSRTCRLVFQSPQSPFHIERLGAQPLPLLRFADDCPVYFDRHTLSISGGRLSMYALDGRMRFDLAITPADEQRFHTEKLREAVLTRDAEGVFQLRFEFAPAESAVLAKAAEPVPGAVAAALPEFLSIVERTE